MRWARNEARMGDMKNAYKILVGIPRRRWEDNIRTNHTEIWWEGVDWMHLVRDKDQWRALANTVINLWVP
jgi:hypothetical protein